MPISVLCVGELLVYVFVGLSSGFSMGGHLSGEREEGGLF